MMMEERCTLLFALPSSNMGLSKKDQRTRDQKEKVANVRSPAVRTRAHIPQGTKVECTAAGKLPHLSHLPLALHPRRQIFAIFLSRPLRAPPRVPGVPSAVPPRDRRRGATTAQLRRVERC